jgi:dimethylamine monooxygenase subunit B
MLAEAPQTSADRRASRIAMRVVGIHSVARVHTLTLAAVDGSLLLPFVPGSHLVVECGKRTNAYSLLDDGVVASEYRISVLLSPDGDGGSRWLHETVREGDTLAVSSPRSAFAPVATARHHLLVAAGIGVTPILSHARAAVRWGRSFQTFYRYRPGHDAHLAELREVCRGGLAEFTDRASFSRELSEALLCQPLGSQLYVCGPSGFTDEVLTAAAVAGWPAARVHTERFSAADLEPGRPFAVRLADGSAIEVPSGISLLEALETKGFRIPNRCRQGVCGECRLDVVGGTPEHRDLYLSEAERAAGDSLMSCVSRGHDDLELAL